MFITLAVDSAKLTTPPKPAYIPKMPKIKVVLKNGLYPQKRCTPKNAYPKKPLYPKKPKSQNRPKTGTP
jgi:hypothetical protein